ncbi:hypothetical protein [Methylophaga sp.]|uniref:Uncharacterized protein n=1 Tax=Methylophaga nitratireducenticrescens TaxID=754476 RepID=I1XFP8_METNJ|nr:hypothetical protein [Methylophaga sp.]
MPPYAIGDRLCGADADCVGVTGSMASDAAAGFPHDHPCALGGSRVIDGGGVDGPAQPEVTQSHGNGVRKCRSSPGGVVEHS